MSNCQVNQVNYASDISRENDLQPNTILIIPVFARNFNIEIK